MGLVIRDARAADAERLTHLLEQLGYPAASEAAAGRIERYSASDADLLVVAELDGEVVGLAALHVGLVVEHDQPAGTLSAIVVDARYRRLGIGEALVSAIETEARERGCWLLFLTSAERRQDAHAFYERVGLSCTGRRFAKLLN